MTKLYKTVIGDSFNKNIINKFTLEEIQKYGNITFSDFDTLEAAECFVSKFPKFINLKIGYCSDWQNNKKTIQVNFRISSLNNSTGEVNEAGLRRQKGLLKILIDENL